MTRHDPGRARGRIKEDKVNEKVEEKREMEFITRLHWNETLSMQADRKCGANMNNRLCIG